MAGLFELFNKTQYELDKNYQKSVTNIFNSILVQYEPANNATLYYYYTVKEGETPEIISHKLYDNSEYHWILLLMNRVIHPFYDWPMDEFTLNAYVKDNYDDPNEVHHFIDLNNNDKWVDEFEALRHKQTLYADFKNATAWGPNETYERYHLVKLNGIYYVYDLYLNGDGGNGNPGIDTDNWVQVDQNLPLHISPVTNIGFERELNNERRNIKVLDKKYLDTFVYQFEKLMESGFNLEAIVI